MPMANKQCMPKQSTPRRGRSLRRGLSISNCCPATNKQAPRGSKSRENVLVHIAGFILRKIKGNLCEGCSRLITGCLTGNEDQTLLVHKQHGKFEEKGLAVQSNALVGAVVNLESAYLENSKLLLGNNVRSKLISVMKKDMAEHDFLSGCGNCNIKKHVIDKFLNIRLHFPLKLNNVSFTQKNFKKETENS